MNPIALVFPVSSYDAELFRALIPVIKKFGPYKGHPCVIAPTIDLKQEADVWKEELKLLFSAVHICPVNKDGAEGYPIGPNRHFRIVAEWMASHFGSNPWWWFEADCCPVVGNWLQAADREYQNSAKRFMGRLVPTRGWTFDFAGNRQPATKGEHMVGAGIYPGNYATTSGTLRSVDNPRIDIGRVEPLAPFDIILCEEIIHWAHRSNSIQHNWATQNYRMEGDVIICDPTPVKPDYVRNVPVQAQTLVVHGCKDKSLINLILGADAKAVEVPKAPEAPAAAPTADSPPDPQVPLSAPRMSFLATRIHALLKDGKSRKVARLAMDLGVSTEQVQGAILDPLSALVVRGPGWVRPKNDSEEKEAESIEMVSA